MYLKSTNQNSIDDIDHIAIRIIEIDENQRHVGILYKDDTEKIRHLHLAWHFQLEDDGVSQDELHIWLESDLSPTKKKQVRAYISMICDNPPNIPYGFSSYINSLDINTGQYTNNIDGHGLTCATFILAIFQAQGIDLINASSWKPRKEDEKWKEKIICYMQHPNSRATKQHINNMKACTLDQIRIRPEEVAGAFTEKTKSWPVNSIRSIQKGEEIIVQLKNFT